MEYELLYTPEGFRATTPDVEQIRKRMEAGLSWVAVVKNHIVGTVSAIADGNGLYVRSMAVLPAARGLGIGRRLLETVEDYAIQHGYERLWLSTTPFLHSAIHLYEEFGFAKGEQGPDELHGTPLFTMIKKLS